MVVAGITMDELTIPPVTSGYTLFSQRHQIIGATHNGFQYLHEALELGAAGKVKPMIELFPKERVAEAFEKVENGKVRFRAVITY